MENTIIKEAMLNLQITAKRLFMEIKFILN